MEYFIQYGMFLAKAVTIALAIIFVLGAIGSSNKQKRSGKKGAIKVTGLNEHIDDMKDALRHSVLDKDELKQVHKIEKKQAKQEQKEKSSILPLK